MRNPYILGSVFQLAQDNVVFPLLQVDNLWTTCVYFRGKSTLTLQLIAQRGIKNFKQKKRIFFQLNQKKNESFY
ncbi:hypothetical protein BTE48_03500 [Oceanospirillum multiglobuliferum]|uniref:Uncharacterized protein n=1 Tax=Oceanospirillum multiglobuliferum TaxID=64969 RepID=A0A1V4T7F1_9GAMM|nr:hypothetical protein BTE48_03500 [Oceanospirillum multiglobuliferum]